MEQHGAQAIKTEGIDIQQVAVVAEKILRYSIFRLLEKIIDHESAEGQLDIFAIPRDILKELQDVKTHAKSYEVEGGNDVDKWIMHKLVLVLNQQIDVIVRTYHKTFHKLTADLDLTDEFSFAYETFKAVCKKLFRNETTWFHILALLCFGSEIAVFVIRQGRPGVKGFLEKVVHYVVEFMVKEEVAEWIAMHGGWMTMVDYFDKPDCPYRATHILTIMTLSEYTHMEVWIQRLATVAVVTGVCLAVAGIFSSYK